MASYLVTRPTGRSQVIEADTDLLAVAALDLPMQTRTFRAVDRTVTVRHAWTDAVVATLYPRSDAEAHALRVEHLDEASWTIDPSRVEYVKDAYERLVNAW